MTDRGEAAPDALADAMIAVRLLAVDPALGGMWLRGREGSEAVVAALPEGAPVRRVPVHVDDERLIGGMDLGATLATGRRVARAGLLAEADGGAIVLPMAERLDEGAASRIAGALDTGGVVVERDGVSLAAAARFVVIAIDEGGTDEAVSPVLSERMAFWLPALSTAWAEPVEVGREMPFDTPLTSDVKISDDGVAAIAATAAALGVDSVRASLFTLRAARAAAALAGRRIVAEEDVALAARLVLGPRATRMPAEPEMDAPSPPEPDEGDGADRGERQALDDLVLEAALASLPRDVLAGIANGTRRGPARPARGSGEKRKGLRGRPKGVRAGIPRGGARLSLIDTLRAAAPWQRVRGGGDGRVLIRKDDLRVRCYETRAQAVTIFAVDASGSAALARLAEAKGAVELMLAEAYVKRAEVALVAFRGTGAELLLPPTRSLARARRSLAELPGGGGTPLAAGLAAAQAQADAARARGRTPFVVVLTDGRANVALDGRTVAAAAESDAMAAAKALRAAGTRGVFIDISARPRAEGARIAAAMGARYLPMPRADATRMHAVIAAEVPK